MAVVHVRDVPEDLHRDIRKLGIDRGESLRAIVIRALERERERMRTEAKVKQAKDERKRPGR